VVPEIAEVDGQGLDEESPCAEPGRVVQVGTESTNDAEEIYPYPLGELWQDLAPAFVWLRIHPKRPEISPGPLGSNHLLDEHFGICLPRFHGVVPSSSGTRSPAESYIR